MSLNLELLKLLSRVFNALDALVQNYGVYLYLVFVWLSLAVILAGKDALRWRNLKET